MRRIQLVTLVSLMVVPIHLLGEPCEAVRRTVPFPYSTIQSAINSCNNGDTVLVSPDHIYYENVDFSTKEITVASHYIIAGDTSMISRTIIDGNRTGSVVTIPGAHSASTRLIGFTLRNGVGSGTGSGATGGGITCSSETSSSNPYIAYCVVEDDSARYGGGVLCYYSSPTLENCIIRNNLAGLDGGGFRGQYNGNVYHGAIFRNCIITGNWSKYDGGGLSAQDHGLRMYNCIVEMNETEDEENGDGGGIFCDNCGYGPLVNTVVCDNYADDDGGGLYITSYAYPILINSILWDNDCEGSGVQIYVSSGEFVNLHYCDVDTTLGGIHGDYYWGPGSICIDPLFYDEVYHLDDDSPCIDAGNDSTRYHDPPNPTYPDSARPPSWGLVRNDMGAYAGPLTANWGEEMIQVSPEHLDFGSVPVGQESTMVFFVGNEGWRDLIVYDIPSSNPLFEMENSVPFEVMEADTEEVSVTFAPDSLGMQNGQMIVKSNDRWMTVTMSGQGSGPLLVVEPDTLDFGPVVVGTEALDTFYIANDGNDTLEVSELSWQNPVFEVDDNTPFLVAPGGSEPLTVTFAPDVIQCEQTTVYVSTDASEDSVLLTGQGISMLSVSPDTMNFGQVVVGVQVIDTFYIANLGQDPLEVEELICESSVFEVEDIAPFPVSPGQSEPVMVTFAPDAVQGEEATVWIIADAGDDSVKLLGQGRPLDPIQNLTTFLAKTNLYLRWEPIAGADHYRICRHTEPLFIPSPEDTLAMTTATSYLDSNAAGNPSINYYYLVFATNELTISPPSNRVGEFDRDLINGNPTSQGAILFKAK